MKNLTTPKAILIGLGLIALAIAIKPITGGLIGTANANQVPQVQICGWTHTDEQLRQVPYLEREWHCATVGRFGSLSIRNLN